MVLDVYKDWLGIEEVQRPLNHYQLLKLKPFEDNTLFIRKQYRQFNAHVKKYATGEFIDQSQALLNELAQAMLCLTDAERKAEYDASLGRVGESTYKQKSFEDILVSGKICTPEQVKKAVAYADAVGLDVYQAALQHKLAPPETIMLAYAESIGLPFISLEDIGVDAEFAPQIPPLMARQHSFVPVMVADGKLLLASPAPVNPDVEQELRMLFDMPIRSVICVPNQVNEAIAKYYPKDAKQFVARDGAESTAMSAAEALEQAALERKASRAGRKKEKEKEQKASQEPAAPLSEEAAKQRLQSAIVASNLTIMATMGAAYFKTGLATGTSIGVSVTIGILLGAAVGGATYMFLSRR
ncbi:MAG: general secretion pathway protein GspE [Planctomycetaceae bacterium]|nr:general secretion pathway protein GspE [Planctomycetaceae bacterium]